MLRTKHDATWHTFRQALTSAMTIILLCLAVLLNAQGISRKVWPLFYEGKTLELLKRDSLVQDLVAPDETIPYV